MDQPPVCPVPERWTAVLNPAAGRGRSRDRLPRVADALAAARLDVTVHVSPSFPARRNIRLNES
jgi:hypothetical protein